MNLWYYTPPMDIIPFFQSTIHKSWQRKPAGVKEKQQKKENTKNERIPLGS